MRAKEFIREMHDWHLDGIPGMKSMGNIGQYYDIYRFGLMMAALGGKEKQDLHPKGDTEDNPTTLSYSEGDEKIINAALAAIGKTARQITPQKSREPKDTNTVSPMTPKGPVKRKSK